MKKIITLVSVTFLLISCQAQPSKDVETIDGNVYSEKLTSTKNPQLLDVRTPDEYAVDHLENSKNINWNGDNFVSETEKLDKSKPVFVYCKSGGRSAQAANKLSEMGFKEIYNLDGGIMKWKGKKVTNDSKVPQGLSMIDYNKLVSSNNKLIVNFNAKWCEPCQKMKPYLLKLQEELKGNTNLIRLDADENKSLLEEMKIDGLPVIIIYEKGKETWRNVGYLSEEDLRKHL